jgi:hypothetical protein
VFFCLLDFDHRDRSTKVNGVMMLEGAARNIELTKTDCLCLWHHWMHTALQLGWSDAMAQPDMNQVQTELGKFKLERGCQHPLHHSMWYAPLLLQNPNHASFLEGSHVFRKADIPARGRAPHLRLLELQSGASVVHCRFCHRLWTICERVKLEDGRGRVIQASFALLLQRFPSFVQHFEVVTQGFDWDAERIRVRTKMSEASKLRESRKRTRRYADQEPSMQAAHHGGDIRQTIPDSCESECATDGDDDMGSLQGGSEQTNSD